MGPFEQFMGMAGRGLETLREAYVLLQRARGKTAEALTLLRGAAEGTSNDKVGVSVARLEKIAGDLDKAAVHAVAGAGEFTAYLRLIGAERAVGAAENAFARERSIAATPAREPRRLSGFRPGRVHPDAAKAIHDEGWPKNSEGRTSARAHLYDEAGTEVRPVTYKPYRKGQQPHRAELADGFNDPERTTTAWHAEADIAQAIRDRGLSEATIYINVPLCGRSSPSDPNVPDPRGCSENFRHTIPKDTVVYIHIFRESGTDSRKRIVGTGEGMKSD